MDAPDLRLARKGQGRGGQLELGFGQRFGGRRRLEIGRRIIARVQTNCVSLREVGNRRLGAVVASVVADPERRVVVRAVISLDASAVGLSADEAIELAARDQFAQLLADSASAGAALVARFGRLGGSGRGVLLRLLLCGAGATCLAGESTSLAVSGGGSVVSGTGTDAVVGFSLCCAMPAWLDRASTKHQRRRGQQTVKSCTFHHVSPKTVRGHTPR